MKQIIYTLGLATLLGLLSFACASAPKGEKAAAMSAEQQAELDEQKQAEQEREETIAYYSVSPTFHKNPEDIKISWQDVDAFWVAVDASRGNDGKSFDQKVFETTYKAKRTGALDAHSKFFYGGADKLYQIYDLVPFYESFRKTMLSRSDFSRERYLGYLKRVQEYYPQAVFPDVYFYVGQMRQGGTATPKGLLIAAEQLQKDTGADYAKLPADEQEYGQILQPLLAKLDKKKLDNMLIHELMHFLQFEASPAGMIEIVTRRDLLDRILVEGIAEFLAIAITGSSFMFGKESPQASYGLPRETELWQKFQQDRKAKNEKAWLHNAHEKEARGAAPPDMGYWLGIQIAKAYWDKMPNKQQAFYDLLHWKDADAILAKSGYAELHAAK